MAEYQTPFSSTVKNEVLIQQYKKGRSTGEVLLTVQFATNGLTKVNFYGWNRHIFNHVWYKPSLEIYYDEELLGTIEMDWMRVPSRLRAGFRSVVTHSMNQDFFVDATPLQEDQVDVRHDPSLLSVDQDIEAAGNTVRRMRILYGESSPEFQEASQALQKHKDRRWNTVNELMTQTKLRRVRIVCNAETLF